MQTNVVFSVAELEAKCLFVAQVICNDLNRHRTSSRSCLANLRFVVYVDNRGEGVERRVICALGSVLFIIIECLAEVVDGVERGRLLLISLASCDLVIPGNEAI